MYLQNNLINTSFIELFAFPGKQGEPAEVEIQLLKVWIETILGEG